MADDDSAGEVAPRGGHAGERTRLAAGGLALLLVSPVAVVCAAATLVWVMGQVRCHWRDIAVAGAAVSAVGVVLLVMQVSLSGVPSLSWWLTEAGVLGVPAGVAAGAGAVGLLERWAAGAEWHPAERRRRAVEDVREDRLMAEHMKSPPDWALGVFRSGDLAPWVREEERR